MTGIDLLVIGYYYRKFHTTSEADDTLGNFKELTRFQNIGNLITMDSRVFGIQADQQGNNFLFLDCLIFQIY